MHEHIGLPPAAPVGVPLSQRHSVPGQPLSVQYNAPKVSVIVLPVHDPGKPKQFIMLIQHVFQAVVEVIVGIRGAPSGLKL